MKQVIPILTTFILLSCGPSKKKTEITTLVKKDVEIEKIDVKNINSSIDSQLKLLSQYTDNSKIRITFYSKELDSSGKQLIDKIVEQENNIKTNANSDVSTKHNYNKHQNTIEKIEGKSIIDTKTKIKEKKDGFNFIFYTSGIVIIIFLLYIRRKLRL